jgi:3-polyprenyl-4-hydroxybenzoate decarboxylase
MTERAVDVLAKAMRDFAWAYGNRQPLNAHDDADTLAAISIDALKAAGMVIVPAVPSFDQKMAGATAITEDHMRKMANYDAAIDCYAAMIAPSA